MKAGHQRLHFVHFAGPGGVPYTDWNRSGVIALGDLWGSPEPVMRWYVLDAHDVPPALFMERRTPPSLIRTAWTCTGLTNVGVTVECILSRGRPYAELGFADRALLANFFAQEWTKVLTAPPAPRPQLSPPTVLSDGNVQVVFTGAPSAAFTVLGTTDSALPVSSWSVLGRPVRSARRLSIQ